MADNGCQGLERVESTQSNPDSFDVVPENLIFRINIKSLKFEYLLKKGKTLPYSTNIKGILYFDSF